MTWKWCSFTFILAAGLCSLANAAALPYGDLSAPHVRRYYDHTLHRVYYPPGWEAAEVAGPQDQEWELGNDDLRLQDHQWSAYDRKLVDNEDDEEDDSETLVARSPKRDPGRLKLHINISGMKLGKSKHDKARAKAVKTFVRTTLTESGTLHPYCDVVFTKGSDNHHAQFHCYASPDKTVSSLGPSGYIQMDNDVD